MGCVRRLNRAAVRRHRFGGVMHGRRIGPDGNRRCLRVLLRCRRFGRWVLGLAASGLGDGAGGVHEKWKADADQRHRGRPARDVPCAVGARSWLVPPVEDPWLLAAESGMPAAHDSAGCMVTVLFGLPGRAQTSRTSPMRSNEHQVARIRIPLQRLISSWVLRVPLPGQTWRTGGLGRLTSTEAGCVGPHVAVLSGHCRSITDNSGIPCTQTLLASETTSSPRSAPGIRAETATLRERFECLRA